MKSKFLITLVSLLILFSFFQNVLAIKEDQNNEIEEITARQQEIKNFQTDADLTVKIFSKQSSSFEFTYYYHEPDLVHLETEDFVLLPTEPLKSLQPSFLKLENYDITLVSNKKENINLYQLDPIKADKKYWIKIWINLSEKQIEKAEIFFIIPSYKKEFSLEVEYSQIEGYSMPVSIQGTIAIPAKFSMNDKVKEFNKGDFDLKLHNYKINQNFPPGIMKKLKD